MDLFDLTDEESRKVEVMHGHIQKYPSAIDQKLQLWRIGVAAQGTKKFDPAEFTSFDFLFRPGVTRIKPAHEPQLNRSTAFPNDVHDARAGAGAVLAALREALSAENYRHLVGQLPAGYTELEANAG